jgi:hypothetical protein
LSLLFRSNAKEVSLLPGIHKKAKKAKAVFAAFAYRGDEILFFKYQRSEITRTAEGVFNRAP